VTRNGGASIFTWHCGSGRKIAKVAMARRLAVRMYWMLRKGWNYEQLNKFGSHADNPDIAMVCR